MPSQIYEFEDLQVAPAKRALFRRGVQVPLSGREFDTLWALVQRSGVPVHKDVFAKEVWPETVVSETNLRQQISALRRKLGKDAIGNEYILTIPNYGYQLAANVVCREDVEASDSVEQRLASYEGPLLSPPEPSQSEDPSKIRPAHIRHSRFRLKVFLLLVVLGGVTVGTLRLARSRLFWTIPESRLPVGRLHPRTTDALMFHCNILPGISPSHRPGTNYLPLG